MGLGDVTGKARNPKDQKVLATQRKKSDSVFLVSPCATDAEHVSTLLHDSGYRCNWLKDLSAVPSDGSLEQKLNNSLATIVCHRKLRDCHASSLTEQYPGQRIIVLSDCQSEQTVVSLLNGGAHYFISFHESTQVLQARLEAALRKTQDEVNGSFAVGNLYFDANKRLVTKNDEPVELAPKEFDFAYYLFSHRDRVVCNSELMTSVWSLPATMDTRRIDTAACRIRKKLLLDEKPRWVLKRLRSIGYRLIPVDSQCESSQAPYEDEYQSPVKKAAIN